MRTSRMLMLSGVMMVAALAAGCADSSMPPKGQPAPTMSHASAAGAILTDQNGMTLYTFDEDADGKSSCYGMCAIVWPPLYVQDGAQPAGDLTVVTRKDGTKQWAKDGMPLYFYAQDKKPADIRGDNEDGTWHLVRPN